MLLQSKESALSCIWQMLRLYSLGFFKYVSYRKHNVSNNGDNRIYERWKTCSSSDLVILTGSKMLLSDIWIASQLLEVMHQEAHDHGPKAILGLRKLFHWLESCTRYQLLTISLKEVEWQCCWMGMERGCRTGSSLFRLNYH